MVDQELGMGGSEPMGVCACPTCRGHGAEGYVVDVHLPSTPGTYLCPTCTRAWQRLTHHKWRYARYLPPTAGTYWV